MTGRRGRNKGSKGKPGFQPVVGKGIKPPTTVHTPVANAKRTHVVDHENKKIITQQVMPRLCADPKVCGVKTHRAGTICKAQTFMDKPQFEVDSKGKLFGYTPQKFVEMIVGENAVRPAYRNKQKNALDRLLHKEGLKMPDLRYLDDDGLEIDYEVEHHVSYYTEEDDGASAMSDYGYISHAKVTVTDTEKVAYSILGSVQHYPNRKDMYALVEVLNYSGIHNEEVLDVEVEDDYYGDNIVGVYIDDKEVKEQLAIFLELSPDDRVRYGVAVSQQKIPEELYGKTFVVEQIDPQVVSYPEEIENDSELLNSFSKSKVDKVTKEVYADAIVKGVVVPQEGREGTYRIVDGFHRHAHTKVSQPAFYIVARGEK